MATESVIEILAAGAKFNLQELRFGSLHIRFGAYQPEVLMAAPEPSAPSPDPGKKSEILPEEEDRLLQERIEQLTIENPFLAETLIASGDLVDEEDQTDGGDDEEA